jgi:hypothetical protein
MNALEIYKIFWKSWKTLWKIKMSSTVKVKVFISEEEMKERVLTADGCADVCASYQFWHAAWMRLQVKEKRHGSALLYSVIYSLEAPNYCL